MDLPEPQFEYFRVSLQNVGAKSAYLSYLTLSLDNGVYKTIPNYYIQIYESGAWHRESLDGFELNSGQRIVLDIDTAFLYEVSDDGPFIHRLWNYSNGFQSDDPLSVELVDGSGHHFPTQNDYI